MAGPRAASLQDLQFLPGFNSNPTQRDAAKRWYRGDRVRFANGMPEKIPGSLAMTMVDEAEAATTYIGTARAVHDWVSLDGQKWIAIGTHKKLYLFSSARLYDITPMRKASNLSGGITTTNASAVVTITDIDHRAEPGDYIRIYDATAVGGLTLSGQYLVLGITDPDNFTITAASAASSGATGGGSFTIEYDISAGLDSNGEGLGYGTADYGEGTYGTPRGVGTGVTIKLRTWSLDNYGEDLIANYRDGAIYRWDRSNGPNSRAEVIANSPRSAKRTLVNGTSGFVLALGSVDTFGNPDAMRVTWNEQNDLETWLSIENVNDPNITNAGGKRLDYGSEIITGLKTRSGNLVWTDTFLYGAQYLQGDPNGFGFPEYGACSIVSPNAAAELGGRVYTMCFDDFMLFDGVLQIMPCEVYDYVFEDFDRDQADKVFAVTNRKNNEIWWFYPSLTGTGECDRYVVWNDTEKCWYYGSWSRTAMRDIALGASGYPFAASGGRLHLHEIGTDEVVGATTTVPAWFLESCELAIGGSDMNYIVRQFVPNFKRQTGTMLMTLKSKGFPQEPTYSTAGPYSLTSGTLQKSVTIAGSIIVFRFDSNAEAGEDFRFGIPQALPIPHGRRRGRGQYVNVDSDTAPVAPSAPVLSGAFVPTGEAEITADFTITAGEQGDARGYASASNPGSVGMDDPFGSSAQVTFGAYPFGGMIGQVLPREEFIFAAVGMPQTTLVSITVETEMGTITPDPTAPVSYSSGAWTWYPGYTPDLFTNGAVYDATVVYLGEVAAYNHLTWTAAAAGTSPIDHYTLFFRLQGETDWSAFDPNIPAADPRQRDDADIAPGEIWEYSVIAYDTLGAPSARSNIVALEYPVEEEG